MSTKTDRLIKKGDDYVAEGLFAQAIKSFTMAISADPRRATTYCRRAYAYYAYLHTIVEDEPNDVAKHEAFTAKVRARKELDLSLKDFNRSLELCPDLAEGHYGQGVIHYEQGRYQEAIASFTNALPLQTEKAQTYYRRASAYEQLNDDAHTLEDLDAAILTDPGYADAYLERGVIYAGQERYTEALREIDKAISLDPEIAHYHAHRAMAMSRPAFDSGDETVLREAVGYLDEAIRLEPKNAESYYNRGLLYGVLGDSESELADFSTTIMLDPDYAAAYRERFQCLSALGQKEHAAQDWVQYCARSREPIRVYPSDATDLRGCRN